MKAIVLARPDQGEMARQSLARVFSPAEISIFEEASRLDGAVSAAGEDIALLDLTSLDSTVPVDILQRAREVFTGSGAELLVILDAQGTELPFLKIFRPYIWKELEQPGIRGRKIFPLETDWRAREGYDEGKHASEAEQYRDRIGERLFSPESVSPDKKHLIQDDIQRVGRVMSLPVGKRLLDVGCSDGSVTLEIARRWGCREVIGIDVAPSAIEEANRRLATGKPEGKISFMTAFIEALDFPDNYFDTVLAAETLEHVGGGQLDISLSNLVRVLKPEGNMIITVPNRYPAARYESEGRSRWKWPAHHHFFSQISLEFLAKRFFNSAEFYPLYPGEKVAESIYLIADCLAKNPPHGKN